MTDDRMLRRAIHVMAKPTGPICNLDCRYCYYLEKERIYDSVKRASDWRMPSETLESYTRQYIEMHRHLPEITFAWQGGEPTLLGVSFFEEAVALQKKYGEGLRINNALQTNGTLIDDAWAAFLKEYEFLVGLSVDGPEKVHDKYRVDKGGRPTFKRVMRGLEFFKKHGVEFNTLTCVQRHNQDKPLEVYRFLKEIGSGFMQFIPIVERLGERQGDDLHLVLPTHEAEAHVTPWSVRPGPYGEFLCTIFDEWVRKDVGRHYVQIFDVALSAWMGLEPPLCVFQETCGDALALEHNGDLYSCDHFVYPEYKLGNVIDGGLAKMATGEAQRKFGDDKRDTLPKYCRECPVYFVCHGECPKHRFITTPEGEPGLNYLCQGYARFFSHIRPYMDFMANELQHERAPANIMPWLQQQDLAGQGRDAPRPNDPCLCGSGKKYKKCCGKKA